MFDLLLAYGRSQSSVTRLRNGSLNVAVDSAQEVAQKSIVYFKKTGNDPLTLIEDLKATPAVVRFSTRFVIVTDYADLIAHDTKTKETIGFPIREIDQHFTFFLPWAGMEKAQYVAESHAVLRSPAPRANTARRRVADQAPRSGPALGALRCDTRPPNSGVGHARRIHLRATR
ncbi:hypothetical protein C5E05_18960 [Pseudoclavibacter sp. AY1H1]|nr:hypothetical protein C5E05_18960 [Pseudoclavibacter sp. AY1H1]PPF74744.1 hypothetical protein C5B99_13395 [Pseudoclavibacter sp. Z016]